MYTMTILYATPEDPTAFKTYYLDTHIPIARQMTGLTRWKLTWVDNDSAYILVAELQTESKEAMDAMLESPEGVAARADLAHFATEPVAFITGDTELVDVKDA